LLWRSAGTEHRETHVKLAFYIDFDIGMPTGIGRYGVELIRALGKAGEAPEIWMRSSQKPCWEALGLPSARVRCFASPERLALRTLPRLWSSSSRLQLVHFPGNALLPVSRRTLRSTLVHDLGPFRFPELKAPADTRAWKAWIESAIDGADCILTNSRSTLDDLLETFPSAGAKARLTRLGVDHLLDAGSLDRKPDPAGHILAVGIVEPRKNLERLFQAYSILLGKDSGTPPLLVAGHDGYRGQEIRGIPARLGIGSRVSFSGYVPESRLRELYAKASCLVHPALYEGFGFTIPEGFSWGLPVAASDRASMKELYSGAAYMFDPDEPESIAEGMASCLSRGVLPSQMEERKRLFGSLTWKSCAEATLDAFRWVTGS
jgi:glycosyltransferase involved in cell wall biosynthesis